MTDPDILRAAIVLERRYGKRAMRVALDRADRLVDGGQCSAAALWIRIGLALNMRALEAGVNPIPDTTIGAATAATRLQGAAHPA